MTGDPSGPFHMGSVTELLKNLTSVTQSVRILSRETGHEYVLVEQQFVTVRDEVGESTIDHIHRPWT